MLKFHHLLFCRPDCLVLLAGLLLAVIGCSENTDNGTGVLLVPQGKVGALPEEREFHQAIEVANPSGTPLSKGDQTRLLAGHNGQYEMRAVMSFLFNLPADTRIVSGTLRLYVLAVNGQKPVNLAVYLLQQEFIESEVTYEQASAASPWATPGGDFGVTPLGSAVYEGAGLDTITIALDSLALNDYLKTGVDSLPLAVLTDGADNYLSLVAREYIPSQAVASRLDLVFTLAGQTTNSVVERRAFMDATLIHYTGTAPVSSLLQLGENPQSQLFFDYDLSALPPYATVNQARLYLSIASTTFIDSFLVASTISSDKSFVPPGQIFVGTEHSVRANDSLLVLNITVTMQSLILARLTGDPRKYLVLTSFSPTNIAGFLEFFPPDWPEPGRRPYLSLIYTDAPEAAKPAKPAK